MKKGILSMSAAIFLTVLFAGTGFAEDSPEAYIYRIENGKVYTVTKPGAEAREVKRMELLPDGTELTLPGGTEAYITCPGCNVVKVTEKDSPYKVKASNLKKDESKPGKALGYFKSALKEFVYPDSKIGKRAFMHVRGGAEAETVDVCSTLLPQNYDDVLPLGETVSFRWDIPGEAFHVEITNVSGNQLVLKQDTTEKAVEIPMGSFSQGYVYNWVVKNEKNVSCSASFSVLSAREADEVQKNVRAVLELLPKDVDEDTKLRVKVGYLLSEGFGYEAKKILYHAQ